MCSLYKLPVFENLEAARKWIEKIKDMNSYSFGSTVAHTLQKYDTFLKENDREDNGVVEFFHWDEIRLAAARSTLIVRACWKEDECGFSTSPNASCTGHCNMKIAPTYAFRYRGKNGHLVYRYKPAIASQDKNR